MAAAFGLLSGAVPNPWTSDASLFAAEPAPTEAAANAANAVLSPELQNKYESFVEFEKKYISGLTQVLEVLKFHQASATTDAERANLADSVGKIESEIGSPGSVPKNDLAKIPAAIAGKKVDLAAAQTAYVTTREGFLQGVVEEGKKAVASGKDIAPYTEFIKQVRGGDVAPAAQMSGSDTGNAAKSGATTRKGGSKMTPAELVATWAGSVFEAKNVKIEFDAQARSALRTNYKDGTKSGFVVEPTPEGKVLLIRKGSGTDLEVLPNSTPNKLVVKIVNTGTVIELEKKSNPRFQEMISGLYHPC